MIDPRFEHERALACQTELRSRIKALKQIGYSADPVADHFNSRLYIYERILPFRFEFYPDYSVPWHLLLWEHCRWDQVYLLIRFIETLRQPTGSHIGEPIRLEPFQCMIVLAFFGPEDPKTHLRLVREGILTLARKNAKTALVAALATALMSISPEQGGLRGQEIQVGASDREQAGITYGMAERYVNFDKELGLPTRFRGVPSKKTITHLKTLTTLRCLSSDAYRHHGANPAVVIFDEIGNVPNSIAEEFYSVLTTGFGAQDEPLTLLLSTQAPNDQHMFSQMVDKAKRLNEGSLQDPEFAGFVFTVPEQDLTGRDVDAFDRKLWALGSPGYGTIYNPKDLDSWAKKARDMPGLRNKYENLKLNRRVSETSALIPRTIWMNNATAVEYQDLLGHRCVLGIDLAETTDLTALVALFDPVEELAGRMPVYSLFFLPGDGIEARSYRDKVPYDQWAREGKLDASSYKVVDYARVAQAMLTMMDDFVVCAVGFDRWKMKYLIKALADQHFELPEDQAKEFFIEVGQGFKGQSRAIDIFEQLLLQERLAHGSHPILNWCAANAVVIQDPAKNRKFEKAKSFGRIDGIVALANAAFARGEFEIETDGESMYEDATREVLM